MLEGKCRVPGARYEELAHVLIACGRNVASSCHCADRPLRGRGGVDVEYVAG